MIGNEGLIGISLFLTSESTPSRAIVQSAGRAYRLQASHLMTECQRGAELQQELLRFTQALIAQMIQTAACNRHHRIDQQFCRWLLMSLDRLPSNEIIMTHALLAHMQGVRREGITAAASELQASGIIEYARGRITVLNRRELEQRVCECYRVVKRESNRLFGISDARPQPASDRRATSRDKDRRSGRLLLTA
jgi:CRP-like cAMP-binding protein